MSTAVSIVRTLLGLLFDHTIGNIVRMIPIIRLPKLERGPVSRGFLALLLGILFFGLTMLFSASYSSAYATSGKLYSIIKPQVMIAIVGLFFMWVLSNINYRALRLMSESLYIIAAAADPDAAQPGGHQRHLPLGVSAGRCLLPAVGAGKILTHALDGRYAGPRL